MRQSTRHNVCGAVSIFQLGASSLLDAPPYLCRSPWTLILSIAKLMPAYGFWRSAQQLFAALPCIANTTVRSAFSFCLYCLNIRLSHTSDETFNLQAVYWGRM